MKLGLLQINATVGDFSGNAGRLLTAYHEAVERGAELILAPELYLCGYPPRDLLQYPDFLEKQNQSLLSLQAAVGRIPLVLGVLTANATGQGKAHYNSAVVLQNGGVVDTLHKCLLPTYDVFDEGRYFQPAPSTHLIRLDGRKIGLTICEDIWNEQEFWPEHLYEKDPVRELVGQGAEIILNISASPWQVGKEITRASILQSVARKNKVPVAQVNLIGGNDELIFDGQSLVINAQGDLLAIGNAFDEDILVVDTAQAPIERKWPDYEAQLFYALARGTEDYVKKCGFQKVLLGLSGGIDSALTAVVAVEALGPDRVLGVLMPGPFSSQGSIDDAKKLAQNLEIETLELPINQAYNSLLGTLMPAFGDRPPDLTEENLQARIRGILLMALSNKLGCLLLTTGNKSELAVGYCTLYGDMCGALAVVNDVPKTWIYRIASWINRKIEIIPKASIEKAPSAELRPDQTDQDSLPPYELLDRILEGYIVDNHTAEELIQRGYPEKEVRETIAKVLKSEYKRRQAAPGLRVTGKAFGVGRRMPIAHRYD